MVVDIRVLLVKRRPIFQSTRRAKETIKRRGVPPTVQLVTTVQELRVVLYCVHLAPTALLGLRVATTRQQRVRLVCMLLVLLNVFLYQVVLLALKRRVPIQYHHQDSIF